MRRVRSPGPPPAERFGLIEAAANNTLLLDEVNSMPLSLQAKLLRVLETKAVIPVGSVKPRAVNFRLNAPLMWLSLSVSRRDVPHGSVLPS